MAPSSAPSGCPPSWIEAKIQATYNDGVLALRLPKQATATPQGIPITG